MQFTLVGLMRSFLYMLFVSLCVAILVQFFITISPHNLRDDINGIPVACYEVSFLLYPDPWRTHFHCKSIRGE